MVCVGCIQPATSASLQHHRLRSWWKCVIITAMQPHSSQRNPASVLGTWDPQTRSRCSVCSPGSPGCWGKSRKNRINFTHTQWWNIFLDLLAWVFIHWGSIFCTLSREGPQSPQGLFLRDKIYSFLSKYVRQHRTEGGNVCTPPWGIFRTLKTWGS